MQFMIERADALAALGRVVGIVPNKADIQLMEHVRVEARDTGTVEFRTCNLETEMVAEATGFVQEAGVTTINANRFHSIVKGFTEGSQVAFIKGAADARAQVKSGRSRFQVDVLEAKGFPTLGTPNWDGALAYPADVLHRAMSTVQHAMSKETVRYYLNGMHFHLDGDVLRMVATDGHQLGWRELACDRPALPRFTIPAKTVRLMLTMLAEAGKGEAVIQVTANSKMALSTASGTLLSKLIDATQYPDYRRVVPDKESLGGRFRVHPEVLGAAVRRVLNMTEDKARSIKLRGELGGDALAISARGTSGEADDEIPADLSEAVELPVNGVGFNGAYVLNALQALGGTNVVVAFSGAEPSVWSDPDDDSGFCILMPLRV